MPFYNNVYYPWPEPQGTHSAAFIPSLLNSPLSQPSSSGQGGAPPSAMSTSSTATIPPFKFAPRCESVDWRRISAVDVELVASEQDINTLQEHVQGVTFCSVEGERCPRCQSPVNPTLLKLFRLAQLTVEYLLHSQEHLSLALQAAEESLAARSLDREQLLVQKHKQTEEVRALNAELRQRKKVMKSQQNMLASRLTNCHKCQHCDKAFMNSSFLQNHMQRRHPEEYDIQLSSDNARKVLINSLKEEVSSLKEQLTKQQQALLLKTTQEKDQQSMHEELMRKLEKWRDVELEQMNRKLEDTRGGLRREMEMIHMNNVQLSQFHVARQEMPPHPTPGQDNDQETQMQAIQRLEQKLHTQNEKWESRLQKMKVEHESEKNQLQREMSRMQLTVSEQQEKSLTLREEMEQRLQEKERTILAQRQQIKHITSNTPTKIHQLKVPVPAPVPEPKPKRVVCEQPLCAPKLDPIEELPEEKDSSSISEKQPEVKRPEQKQEVKRPEQKQEVRKQLVETTTSVLRKNPKIKRELRPAVEQALLEKLEALGVTPGLSGLRNREYSELVAKVRSERESVAREISDYWRHRETVAHTLELRLMGKRSGKDLGLRAKPRKPLQVTQNRLRSSSLPPRVTQVMSGPLAKQLNSPQPAPRPKTSTPKTPPFSSDEEDEEEETEEDEEKEQPQKHRWEQGGEHKAPQPRTTESEPKPVQSRRTHANPVQSRLTHANPVQSRRTNAKPIHAHTSLAHIQPLSPKPQQAKGPMVNTNSTAVNTTKSAVLAVESEGESEGEWTEGSEMEEIDLQQFQDSKDQNGNVKKTANSNLVKHLTKSLEEQLADRGPKIPLGGVSTLPESKDVVRELKYTQMDESSEDWDVSSLEDLAVAGVSQRAHSSAPVRKSLDSSGTSVWGTSTGKGQKSGLNEAGNGNTLKSSLVSVSDFSDSDDV